MNTASLPRYFLGANSDKGFINKFADVYAANDKRRIYIIKGGPGTGKSTFMKRVASEALSRGISPEICPCSSDPESLDAVILPELNTAILDGTAPHTVEPKYVGIYEEILDFGAFISSRELRRYKNELLTLFEKHKKLHRTASGYIGVAGKLMRDNLNTALCCTDIEKTVSAAERAFSKLGVSKSGDGSEQVRFISGITPKGRVFFSDTVDAAAKKKTVIYDRLGTASAVFLSVIRDLSLKSGLSVINCRNFLTADELCDCIIIPELSAAFCAENPQNRINGGERRIHAERFYDVSKLNEKRIRTAFNRKTADELLSCASDILKEAKATHDEIEKYYKRAVNFEALDRYGKKIISEKIFAENT